MTEKERRRKILIVCTHNASRSQMAKGLFRELIAKIAILFCWGFSSWWFVMACIMILYYLKNIELPFALTWWAFTFPSGALCIASAVAWKVTGFASIFYFFILATVFMLIVWLVVFLRTAKGMASGKIFLPVH